MLSKCLVPSRVTSGILKTTHFASTRTPLFPLHSKSFTSSTHQSTTTVPPNNTSSSSPSASSAPVSHPSKLESYEQLARLDKPIGTLLLLLPCWWGTALGAYPNLPPLSVLGAFGVGALAMRGAGCTVNDMWDVKFDQKVERTKTRPIASGAVTRSEAAVFALAQSAIGFSILPILGGANTALIAFLGVPLAILYPAMKRITYHPQLWLGMTFNWGLYVGYASVQNGLELLPLLIMHLGTVAWTFHYDTVYAYQDMKDDINCGVKSTALYYGKNKQVHKNAINFFTACTTVASYLLQMHPIFYGVIGASHLYLHRTLKNTDFYNNQQCWNTFTKNRYVGYYLFLGIVLCSMYQSITTQDIDESTDPTHAYEVLYTRMHAHTWIDTFVQSLHPDSLLYKLCKLYKVEELGKFELVKITTSTSTNTGFFSLGAQLPRYRIQWGEKENTTLFPKFLNDLVLDNNKSNNNNESK